MSDRLKELTGMFLVRRAPMPVEWLESNIRIPREMSPRRPGPFRADPYQREPLNCWHPESGVSDVITSAGAQITKTTNGVLGLSYRMKWRPLPSLWVMPSEDSARKQIAGDKLKPLINANAVLAALKPKDGRLFGDLEMELEGMQLSLAGANSPAALGGRTKGIIVIDEAAKIVQQNQKDAKEAHPIKLASERAKDLKGLSFRWVCSTPNLETNYFWLEWERGDQRQYWVPCPNCAEPLVLDWVVDEASGYRSIVWPEECRNATGVWVESKVKEMARFICPCCEYPIRNEEKAAMIQGGEWKPSVEGEETSIRSYVLPSFYSSQSTWGDCAVEFLQGQDLFGLQNFTNSWRARPYSEVAVNVKKDAVERCRQDWFRKGQVRGEVDYLVATADPGQHKTHWAITAIFKNGDQAPILWGTVLGIPLLATIPQDVDGVPVKIRLVDSRWDTDAVLEFCANSKGAWWPTMGQEAGRGTWKESKVATHPGLLIYNYSDYNLKFELYARMIAGEVLPLAQQIELGAEQRKFLLPADADAELVAHHSGQQLMEDKGNRGSRRWKRLPNDHWGDCSKLATLARMVVDSVRRATAQAGAGAVDTPTVEDGPNFGHKPHRVS